MDKIQQDLLKMALGLVRFPYPQICRHSVALDVMQVLQDSGMELPEPLVKAIVDSSAGDEEAERILLELLKTEG